MSQSCSPELQTVSLHRYWNNLSYCLLLLLFYCLRSFIWCSSWWIMGKKRKRKKTAIVWHDEPTPHLVSSLTLQFICSFTSSLSAFTSIHLSIILQDSLHEAGGSGGGGSLCSFVLEIHINLPVHPSTSIMLLFRPQMVQMLIPHGF